MKTGKVQTMSLQRLLAPWVEVTGPAVGISGLSVDSRAVAAGALFVALPGRQAHGLDYLDQALARGAAAVAWEAGDDTRSAAMDRATTAGLPVVEVPQLGRHLGAIAARFYGEPSRELDVVAVTGTDGKTSVTHFAAQLLSEPGAPWGVIGTLGWGCVGALAPQSMTTPDAPSLQRALAMCRQQGCRGVALEASSHALEQGRLNGSLVDVAVLTHLGRDHLDYHGSQEAYADAKGRLFELPSLRAQVLNLDDPFGQRLLERASGPTFTYSVGGAEAELRAEGVEAVAGGVEAQIHIGGRRHLLRLPLLGRFNLANALAAAAATLALGRPLDDVLAQLAELRPVPGRMERFESPGAPLVVVDYAHTPGALAHALQSVREHVSGSVTVVFGCGGERDRGKRPEMGAVAGENADQVVVTDDNPRSEDGAAIREAIVAGIDRAVVTQVIADREEAIAFALSQARPGDVVLVAGKGHEASQQLADREIPLSDREIVMRLLGTTEGGHAAVDA